MLARCVQQKGRPVDISRRIPIGPDTEETILRDVVGSWVEANVPAMWQQAALEGRRAIRAVRSRAEYEAWYPAFAASGLAVSTWPVVYGGLDLSPAQARVTEGILAPFNLGRLNPLGLHNAAPALFAHGTEEQRLRFLPPLVANVAGWCLMYSDRGGGSDRGSPAMRAPRDGEEWVLSGQKVWSTWAQQSEFAICLARSDPSAPKRKGITYFAVDLRSPGVEVRELRHLGGMVDFSEVWLDEVRVPDAHRIGAANDGWTVAGSTLAGERQMVAGSGSGGVDRIGGSGADSLVAVARENDAGPVMRDRVVRLYIEEQTRRWTNERGPRESEGGRYAGTRRIDRQGSPGPAQSGHTADSIGPARARLHRVRPEFVRWCEPDRRMGGNAAL
jgi:hypothetical protein